MRPTSSIPRGWERLWVKLLALRGLSLTQLRVSRQLFGQKGIPTSHRRWPCPGTAPRLLGRTCTDSADYDKSGKKLPTALLQQSQGGKNPFWLQHIPCAAQLPCVWNLSENCWAETCAELGALWSLVIKPPRPQGFPLSRCG